MVGALSPVALAAVKLVLAPASRHAFRSMAATPRAVYHRDMAYQIRYYDKHGNEIGSAPWAGTSIEGTKRIAQDGLSRHNAASVRIFDEDQNNRQVWPRL